MQARDNVAALLVQFNFVYGSGGTSVDAWVQTSFDGGSNWCDIANFHGTTTSLRKIVNLSSETPVTSQYTATDGTLAANSAVDGLLGSQYRVKFASAGTYAGNTSLAVDVVASGSGLVAMV
jgi:hypothetical protein